MKKLWTDREVQQLKTLYTTGKGFFDIAHIMGRSYESVSAKYYKLAQSREVEESKVPPSTFPKYDKPLVSQGDAVILSDVEAPFQHSDFINRVLDLAQAWNITTLHLAGDLLHYDNLSAWGSEWVQDKEEMLETFMEAIETLNEKSKEKVREKLEESGLLENGTLSGELSEARKVFRSFGSFKEIYVALGNHDDRYLRALDKALSPHELLHQLDRHEDKRWNVAPYYYTLIETEQGVFRAEHPRGAGKSTAIDLTIQYHQHVIMGHSHRWSVNRDPSGKYWAIQTGHCVDESRLAYVMQRSAKRDAHVNGATIIRGGYPFVLCPETPWDIMKRM
jgi:hypothetical protein